MGYNIDELKQKVLETAEERREAAALGGESGDGGAHRLIEQVRFYELGESGVIPEEWSVYAKQLDPEWEEYCRLKKKFGGAL